MADAPQALRPARSGRAGGSPGATCWPSWWRSSLVVGGVYLVFFSSTLSVQGVEVSGTQTLTEQQVREVAAVPMGGPLATVDLDRIAYRVRSLAVVKSAEVTRQWPHDVLIEIVERQPVAVVEIAGELHSLDEDGVVFGSYQRAPEGLPRGPRRVGRERRGARRGRPAWSPRSRPTWPPVDYAEVLSVDQITCGCATGARCGGGARSSPRRRPRCSQACWPARPRCTTSACRDSRPSGTDVSRLRGLDPPHDAACSFLRKTAVRRRVSTRGAVRLPTVFAHDEVDITITLRLRVRVPDPPFPADSRPDPHER